jgi:hypothetical protein
MDCNHTTQHIAPMAKAKTEVRIREKATRRKRSRPDLRQEVRKITIFKRKIR